MQCQQRAVAVGCQRDGHLRLPFRRRMPRPAEHQPLVRHYLAIDAADFVNLVIGSEADAKMPADPRVDVGLTRTWFGVRAPEPSDYFFRIRPRGVDFGRRRIEAAFDGKAWSCDKTGNAGSV